MRITGPLQLIASTWLLVGCSRANPEFGAEQEGSSSNAGTSQGNGPGSTSSSATRTSGGSATSNATTSSADSTTSPPDDSGPKESSGPGPVCPSYPDDSISIMPIDTNGAPISGSEDCNTIIDPPIGEITASDGIIQLALGACGGAPGVGYNILLSNNVTIPPLLPDCGRIVVWEGYRNGVCEWIGAAVFNDEDPEPEFVVANSRGLINEVPFVAVGFQEADVCLDRGDCREFPPGEHGLVFGANTVLPGREPQSLDLEFLDEPPYTYRITNHMSWVDVACDEHVAWDAALQ